MKVAKFMIVAKCKDKTFFFPANSLKQMGKIAPDEVLKVCDEVTGYRYVPKEGYVQTFKEVNRKIGFCG